MKRRDRKRHLDQVRSHQEMFDLTPEGVEVLYQLVHDLRPLVEFLVALDPAPDTPDGKRLAWASAMLERVERMLYTFPTPSVHELDEFRREMESAND